MSKECRPQYKTCKLIAKTVENTQVIWVQKKINNEK